MSNALERREGVDSQAQAGRYLSFGLGGDFYGLEILKVQEIIGLLQVTRMPRSPEYIRGVINLRGRIIPVLDLRARFGLESHESTERSCIIVVRIDKERTTVTTGLLVDEVSEVLNVQADQIEPPPVFGDAANTDFILGMGKVNQKVVMLLDVDRILSFEDAVFDEFATPDEQP